MPEALAPKGPTPEGCGFGTEASADRTLGLDRTLAALGLVPSVLLVFAALDDEEAEEGAEDHGK